MKGIWGMVGWEGSVEGIVWTEWSFEPRGGDGVGGRGVSTNQLAGIDYNSCLAAPSFGAWIETVFCDEQLHL